MISRAGRLTILLLLTCVLAAHAAKPKGKGDGGGGQSGDSQGGGAGGANGAQVGISYRPGATVRSTVSLHALGESFYGDGADLQTRLDTLFSDCKECSQFARGYAVVLFLAKPTASSPQAALAHAIYSGSGVRRVPLGTTVLPGVRSLTWVYITEHMTDAPLSTAVVSAIDNPLWSDLGSLAGTVVPVVAKTQPEQALVHIEPRRAPVYLFVSDPVAIRNTRSTIAENDYIVSEKAETTGSFTIANTPPTWVNVSAGAAALVGRKYGASPMKVDNKAYTNDPLPLGITCAGLTFHMPYQSWDPDESWQERYGVSLLAVLTPALGVGVGPSATWRGLGVNAGYAWMRVNAAPSGKRAGDAVDAGTDPQVVNRIARSFYLGVSYALK